MNGLPGVDVYARGKRVQRPFLQDFVPVRTFTKGRSYVMRYYIIDAPLQTRGYFTYLGFKLSPIDGHEDPTFRFKDQFDRVVELKRSLSFGAGQHFAFQEASRQLDYNSWFAHDLRPGDISHIHVFKSDAAKDPKRLAAYHLLKRVLRRAVQRRQQREMQLVIGNPYTDIGLRKLRVNARAMGMRVPGLLDPVPPGLGTIKTRWGR
jgi:hypothetical protein